MKKSSLLQAIDRLANAEIAQHHAEQERQQAKIELGVVLRSERRRKGVSLRRVALELGVSAPFLSDVELGRRFLVQEKLNRYVAFLQRA